MNHIVLYSESGRFGGWPVNHGLWAWENEIVVGFQSCTFKVIDEGNHAIDKSKPRLDLQARSLDGGRHPERRWRTLGFGIYPFNTIT